MSLKLTASVASAIKRVWESKSSVYKTVAQIYAFVFSVTARQPFSVLKMLLYPSNLLVSLPDLKPKCLNISKSLLLSNTDMQNFFEDNIISWVRFCLLTETAILVGVRET